MDTAGQAGDWIIDTEQLEQIIPDELAGKRLDQVLAQLFPQYSRSRLQKWIRQGLVLVDDAVPKPRDAVLGGELVEISVAHERETGWQPQAIELDIVYQDEAIIVINKPAGLVVHPGAGNADGTLANALLHFDPQLEKVPRAGIIHRLDKDTSGLLVVARSLVAQTNLVEQLQSRNVTREYQALVSGVMTAGGTVDQPIGRHPVNRLRMAVIDRGREAITHYRVMERFRAHTHIRVQLETGRTHQIRVHMAYIHYPLVGDPLYGGRLKLPPACAPELIQGLRAFKRQALHAGRLGLLHPLTGEAMEWSAALPADMVQLIELLQHDAQQHSGQ